MYFGKYINNFCTIIFRKLFLHSILHFPSFNHIYIYNQNLYDPPLFVCHFQHLLYDILVLSTPSHFKFKCLLLEKYLLNLKNQNI